VARAKGFDVPCVCHSATAAQVSSMADSPERRVLARTRPGNSTTPSQRPCGTVDWAPDAADCQADHGEFGGRFRQATEPAAAAWGACAAISATLQDSEMLAGSWGGGVSFHVGFRTPQRLAPTCLAAQHAASAPPLRRTVGSRKDY
jgi:hypothetical protein